MADFLKYQNLSVQIFGYSMLWGTKETEMDQPTNFSAKV